MFGLSLYTGDKELRELFGKYGPIEEVQIIYDHQTRRSRGFAFIYYDDSEDAVDVSCWNGDSVLESEWGLGIIPYKHA